MHICTLSTQLHHYSVVRMNRRLVLRIIRGVFQFLEVKIHISLHQLRVPIQNQTLTHNLTLSETRPLEGFFSDKQY